MKVKREYWQAIRGICILAVVLIHALGGFDYIASCGTGFIILRQIINFAVATFVFMSGYFVSVDRISSKNFNYREWLIYRGGGRLCIPFVIWSLLYSGISLLKDIHHGTSINWLGYAYRFVIGKSATPFYYIVVLIQLTAITPWLVKVVKGDKRIQSFLWLVTPCYLLYLYAWNFTTGSSPRLYETLFPAWFGFYYLGIQIRCGFKLECSAKLTGAAFLASCIEAFGLRSLGMSIGFYTSQITIGSFLYSIAVIGWLLKMAESQEGKESLLARIGDCSYGIFYIHMAVLMVIGKLICSDNWFAYWSLRFVLTSTISFSVVYVSQKIFRNKKDILKYIGFL